MIGGYWACGGGAARPSGLCCLDGWRQAVNARVSGARTASLAPRAWSVGQTGGGCKTPPAKCSIRSTSSSPGAPTAAVARRSGAASAMMGCCSHGGVHAGQGLWRKPPQAALAAILHNPASTGALVYGRRGPPPQRRPGHTRQLRRPLEAWPTSPQATYPASSRWAQFLAHQARLMEHASTVARRARGAPRQGQALRAGLVACGRCGSQRRGVYKPQRRYTGPALAASYGAATCLHVDGASLARVVGAAFFAALAPADLALLEEVLAAQRTDQARWAQHYAEQVTRAAYAARLAQRHYPAVAPAQRLVAAELERHWEVA
jgi:hypothetical protein